MAVFEETWQKTKATITERANFLFNNDLLSDVSLAVRASSDNGEPSKKRNKMAIPAHKFVLSICSPVFFAMFYGEMADKSDSVDLADCEYEGVLEMLRYMYSGKAQLNESNVMQVLYVAKKYMVNCLTDECVRLLRKKLDPANVFCVLSHAQQYDEKILVDQCWKLIDRETELALKSEEFATIEKSLLEAVVKRDTLTISEIELFKAVDLWASKECERQGLSTNRNVKRRILGEKIVKEIRFPVMEKEEFASVVPDSKILTSREVSDMKKHFNSVLKSPVGFQGDQRVGTCQSCFRFGHVSDMKFNVEPNKCLNFRVDKDVMLLGIRLFGKENISYKVTLTVEDASFYEPEIVVVKRGSFSSVMVHNGDCSYYGFDVMFDPVRLNENVEYNVKVAMDGLCSSYGINDTPTITSHGVTFSFWNCDVNLASGFHECGQIGDLFFKLP